MLRNMSFDIVTNVPICLFRLVIIVLISKDNPSPNGESGNLSNVLFSYHYSIFGRYSLKSLDSDLVTFGPINLSQSVKIIKAQKG